MYYYAPVYEHWGERGEYYRKIPCPNISYIECQESGNEQIDEWDIFSAMKENVY